jgi:hypothetical protein
VVATIAWVLGPVAVAAYLATLVRQLRRRAVGRLPPAV